MAGGAENRGWETIPERPIEPGSAALIVGNGPSSDGGRWRWALREVEARHADPALVMVNLRATSGKTIPRYAISVDPEILLRRYPSTLAASVTLITNHPLRVVRGHEAEFEEAHAGRTVYVGSRKWPAHASGPLAVWAMTRLGYETVYIVGLDGTAIADAGSQEIAERAAVWEGWTSRYKRARGAEEVASTRLVRVWTGTPPAVDPIAKSLAETLVVGPPAKARP